MKRKSAAIVTIHHAPKMTIVGRKAIAKWLRAQAVFLVKYGNKLAPRFTARYGYK